MPSPTNPKRGALRVAPSSKTATLDAINTEIALVELQLKSLRARKKDLQELKRSLRSK